MSKLQESVDDFLSGSPLAVAGVSREGNLPANHIYRKIKAAGYEVFPVNPKAEEVEGERCYPDLASLPVKPHGLVIAAPPEAALALVKECIQEGVDRVWMHRSIGGGSVDQEAVDLCRAEGLSVIPGACPMMYLEPVDLAHRCFRWILGGLGKLPEPSNPSAGI